MLDQLPERIRSRISLRLDDDHWHWVGSILRAREVQRLRIDPYIQTDGSRGPRGPYKKPGRPLPEDGSYPLYTRVTQGAKSQINGESAIRVIAAHILNIPIKDVPRTKRCCVCDDCVNPDHYQLRRSEGSYVHLTDWRNPGSVTRQHLIKADISPWLSVENASLELGQPIPPDVWAEFQANPPEDD